MYMQGNSPISLHRAKGSHKFFSKWTACFHVTFKAAWGLATPSSRRLRAPASPAESITLVVQFHTKGNSVPILIQARIIMEYRCN